MWVGVDVCVEHTHCESQELSQAVWQCNYGEMIDLKPDVH